MFNFLLQIFPVKKAKNRGLKSYFDRTFQTEDEKGRGAKMKQTSKFQDDSTSCIIFNVLSGAIKNEFKINYCTLKEKTFFSQRMMLINVKQLTKLSTNRNRCKMSMS